ncbi:MAG: putative toxin-antitoxin system toxin component, PIN family [Pyrinomonadaceae bacterium]
MSQISAVFDCNVFIQSLLNPNGGAADCLELERNRVIVLFVSTETINEFRDVIFRPHLSTLLPDLSVSQIESLIEDILTFSNLRRPKSTYKFDRDPKDAKYIDLAIESRAEYLITRDNDLLGLMTDYTVEAKEFRQRFRNLKIVDPDEFLRIIRKMELSVER